MPLLVDIDALCKLAHWRLLSQLPELTGQQWEECATLESAKYRARRSVEHPDGRIFHSTDAAQEALNSILLMTGSISPDAEHMSRLQDLSGVDAGEAVLFAAIACAPDARLLTGDKRALRTISALPKEARASYAGKIVAVEQVLMAALDKYGLERLRLSVCPWKMIDIAVSSIMGSHCDMPESSVREGLTSYINELACLCEPTLIAGRL